MSWGCLEFCIIQTMVFNLNDAMDGIYSSGMCLTSTRLLS